MTTSLLRSFTLLLFFFAATVARAETLPIGPDWRYIGQEAAPVKAKVTDVVYDGAHAQAVKISAAPLVGEAPREAGIVRQAVNVDLKQHGVLSFKAKFVVQNAATTQFTLVLKGPGVSLSRKFSPNDENSKQAENGFSSYEWDLRPALRGDKSVVTEMSFTVDYKELNGDDRLEFSVIDFVFNGEGGAAPVKAVPPPHWVRQEPVKYRDVPLKGWSTDTPAAGGIEVENVMVQQKGKPVPALRLTYRHADKFTPVSLPFPFNADRENVLTFQAKVEVPTGSKVLGDTEAPMTGWYSYQFNEFFDNFGVGMKDKYGFDWTAAGVPRTHFLQQLDKSKPEQDGFKTFLWDMKNDNPTGNKGFNLEEVQRMQFFYDNRKIAPGEKVIITIIKPQLATGLSRLGGDISEYSRFKKYIENYQPDYSDSSKYLGPPEEGRLPKALPLVAKGKAIGEIVGRNSVWDAEGNAARELYQWIFRLTGGAEMPIVAAPSTLSNTKIFIGLKNAEKLFPEDVALLKGSDGCAIRTRDNNVYIFGATPKGTLNGVYTFLEGNSDIIWPRPSEVYGAVYSQSPDLAVSWGEYSHRAPARNWGWMGKTDGPQFDYQVRNRANYLGLRSDVDFKYWDLYMEEGGGHNLHSWIPWSLFKTHPEYWAEIDGKRQHPNGYKNQICLTNHDGRDEFIAGLLRHIRASPQAMAANCYNVKIEDNWGVCEDAGCMMPIRLPDGTLIKNDDIAFRSTQFFMFLNEVANALHNDGLPNMQIGTYVYFYTVPVPKIPVTNYLRPYFCDYVRKDQKVPIYAPINENWWRILNEWTQISDKVVIREYTGLYVYFRPLAEVAKFDIQAELKAGALEFTSESLPESISESPGEFSEAMDVASMEFWVISRLYWDPDADVEQLRKYFLRRTFREGAPEMEKFYGTFRQLYFDEKRTSDFEENQETLNLAIRAGKEKELRNLLVSAHKQAQHPLSKQMIMLTQRRFDKWCAEIAKAKA